MLRNILVGLDGSEYCESAAQVAIEIARKLGCKLYGLGVIDVPSIFDPSPGVAGSIYYKESADRKQYEEAKKRVSYCLRNFEENCAKAQISCEIHHSEGSPLEEFIKEASGYDVIMFGQKTYFEKEKREGPCSTLLHILKDTPRPVVVAPKNITYNSNQPAVISFDGSMPSARAMQLFTLISYDDLQKEVHLLTICDELEEGHERQSKARLYLERWYGHKPVSVVRQGKRSETILEYAREVDARIIVMGAYGKGGLKTLFFGSNTRTMLEKAECLLFLYH